MDRQIINKRITGIQSEIDKLVRTLCAMENTDLSQYPENYEMLSTDAALRAELITCRLRHLIYSTTNIKKSEYLASAGVVQGIEIECKDGILEITLPSLLPKRKQRRSTEFLVDPLYFTMMRNRYVNIFQRSCYGVISITMRPIILRSSIRSL